MVTRQVLIGAVLAGVLASAACAAPAPTATPTQPPAVALTPTKAPTATPTKMPLTKATVTSASTAAISYLSMMVALAKGYFLEEGLDIDWVGAGSGAKALTAVIGGSSLIGTTAAPDVITAVAQKQPVQAFAVDTVGQHGDLLIRKDVAQQRGITEKMSLAEKAKATKGLRFGASSPGSASDYRVRLFLSNFGVDPERDVEISYLGTDALVAALVQGALDVVSVPEPNSSMLLLRGDATMLVSYVGGDVPGTKETLFILGVAQPSTMKAQPAIIEAFVRGVWRGQRLVMQKPDEALAGLTKFFPDMEPAVLKSAFNNTKPGVPDNPGMSEAQFKATLDYRNRTTPGEALSLRFEDFYTPKFVEAAKKQLGF